ncbi:DNA-directed RNA polymerases IV and V subunit 4-like isoform X2 [Zingiber officinale]|uniref:DNA-directed RNA polymerases IV and V subunit 4-like isoform X2 n=1 Tax=Zingiber officinale TaxID=94328 RepID=UPI001C4ADB80|nr:DNA-directed RNA polymerases IV and V subunit 4-like isoform X2 [Zingiber officinale]
MADKGGKGSAFPGGNDLGSLKGKSAAALKESHVEIELSDSDGEGFIETPLPSSKGKSSAEAKSGKKRVSFSSLKTSGDLGKSSNVGKAGGKGSLPQATPLEPLIAETQLKLELELPKGARLLMDCEAAEVLQDIHEHMTVLSQDPKIKMPESFSKAFQYSKVNDHYNNAKAVRQVLETLKLNAVTDGEICLMGNVCPENVDEVYALIPSLKGNIEKNEVALKDAIASLAKFRTPK